MPVLAPVGIFSSDLSAVFGHSGQASATAIVATPHCGACSFAVDLSSDDISRTAGRQSFALAERTYRWNTCIEVRTSVTLACSP